MTKMQIDQMSSLKDQLQVDLENVMKENEKLKTISEDVIKSQDLLMMKLDKKTMKLEKYEQLFDAKANNPNKSIQCNIDLPNTTNIHSASLNIPISNSNIKLPNQHSTLTETNIQSAINESPKDDIEYDKASLMSDDQEEVIKGKLSAAKVYTL